jgi:hypothetical protein
VHSIQTIAPAFIEIAHRIVWCVAATSDAIGDPTTRVLHPIWEFDGTTLTGWVATSPTSPKANHLRRTPHLSVTYWDASHDTCTADCEAIWDDTAELRQTGWERFKRAPAPVGYDPAIIPGWVDPQTPEFGVLRLAPTRLRVMPGSLMLEGRGELMTWRRPRRHVTS